MPGQILHNEPTAHRSIMRQGDRDLAREREKLFLELIGSAAFLSALTKGLSEDLTGQVHEGLLIQSGTRLSLQSAGRIHTDAVKGLKSILEEADELFRGSVIKAIIRSSDSVSGFLLRSGLTPLTTEQIRKIQEDVFRLMDEEFPPGSGVTYRMRLDRIHRAHGAQMNMVLKRSHPQGSTVPNIMRDIRNGIFHTEAVRTPIAGGSAAKKLQRLLVAEESRLANEVERRVFQASGVNFGYWRLSPLHKWYGGNEICEILASNEDPRVSEMLARSGRALSKVPLKGLYSLNRWPDYPHPYCKCYLEPLI